MPSDEGTHCDQFVEAVQTLINKCNELLPEVSDIKDSIAKGDLNEALVIFIEAGNKLIIELEKQATSHLQ